MENQPQNPEFRNSPENSHPCIGRSGGLNRNDTKRYIVSCKGLIRLI